MYLCRASRFKRRAKRSSPCVYLCRAPLPKRIAKSGLCRAPDRKRPAKEMVHGNDRVSSSGGYAPLNLTNSKAQHSAVTFQLSYYGF
jgi:hypothetical protein